MTAVAQAKPVAEGEVTITRVFDAPRAVVFKAWTDARQLTQWWGPHGFTNPVCEIDARAGGELRIHMRAPDGTIHRLHGVIREIVAPERLVFSSFTPGAAGNLMEGITTVTFAEQNGKTKMTVHTRAAALVEEALAWLGGMNEGWTQNVDRLEAFLAKP